LLFKRNRCHALDTIEGSHVVDLTFGTEARICAVRRLGSRLSNLQFWFLTALVLEFVETVLVIFTWKSFFLFSFFFFELLVMMAG
jgi:hypothetical protein